MKRTITTSQFRELPPKAQRFIFAWQQKNGLPFDPGLDVIDCIELIKELTPPNYSKDNGYNGWRSHVLECQDITLAWESDEIIDDLYWELKEAFKQRLATGTLPDPA